MNTKEELLTEVRHESSVQTVDTEHSRAEPNSADKQPGPAQRKVRVGFTAAVLEDGEFVFNIHGTNPGLVELHGLLEFARKVIDTQMKDQLNIDEAAILHRLEQLSTDVKELHERVKSLGAS